MLLNAAETTALEETLRKAHLEDRLSKCGCSLQTLRICTACKRVTCRCQRLGLNSETEGRCVCAVVLSAHVRQQ